MWPIELLHSFSYAMHFGTSAKMASKEALKEAKPKSNKKQPKKR